MADNLIQRLDETGKDITNDTQTEKKIKVEYKTSYKQDSKEKCWYDDCNCEEIMPADCDSLVEENNHGVGRFACMAENQKCYNQKFFSAFISKVACQFDHVIQNICGLWDMVQCMSQYLGQMGDLGTTKTIYLRNSSVSSSDFYHPASDSYDLDIYMDSTTGVVEGESDDKQRTLTDRKYRAYIRWCADGTGLDPTKDNTMLFTVYTSSEQFTDDMEKNRSVHWQMKGVADGAMEMSDSIMVSQGDYIRIHVTSATDDPNAIFRVHQFKVEYSPVIDGGELPDCIQVPKEEEPCECADKKKKEA